MAQQKEDPHAHHLAMMNQTGYARSVHTYETPQLDLINMDSYKVSLTQILASDKPVMLNFIFTTCTNNCPVLSTTFTQLQREPGTKAKNVRMISFSIDLEQDSPQQLIK